MPEHGQQNLLHTFVGTSAFVLVFSLWLAGMLLWVTKRRRRSDRVMHRLELVSARPNAGGERVLRLWHDGKEATTVVPGRRAGGIIQRLQKLLIDAGMDTEVSMALLGFFSLMLTVGTAAYMWRSSVFVAIAAMIGVPVLVWLQITQRIAKRMARFEAQLIDAMELAARSLRVGHPLIASFQLIADEIPAPVGELFGEVCQQQTLGVAMDEALRSASESVDSADLRLLATSVVIQLRTGGNLADMMQRLSNIIRERNRLTRRVRVLTAQTQFSKRVLLALPFLVFISMNVINPTYMLPLYSTFGGQLILGGATVGMLAGWMLMNWLSKLST
jgi:tight adherence protein B